MIARLSTLTPCSSSTLRPFWNAFSMMNPIPTRFAPDCLMRSRTPNAAFPYARKSSTKSMLSFGAVSYTHLDVYKRQDIKRTSINMMIAQFVWLKRIGDLL